MPQPRSPGRRDPVRACRRLPAQRGAHRARRRTVQGSHRPRRRLDSSWRGARSPYLGFWIFSRSLHEYLSHTVCRKAHRSMHRPKARKSRSPVVSESRAMATRYTCSELVWIEGGIVGSRLARRRYCRCGTQLAADNSEDQCARCQRAARDKLIAPPHVPAEFWQAERSSRPSMPSTSAGYPVPTARIPTTTRSMAPAVSRKLCSASGWA